MGFLFGWLNQKKDRTGVLPHWLKNLKAGDIALDCGANVGKITVPMAQTGAAVYAFEPNPHAFAKLKEQLIITRLNARKKPTPPAPPPDLAAPVPVMAGQRRG